MFGEVVARNTNEDSALDRIASFAHSDMFERMFREGMDLVEETAAYLDGEGRADAKKMSRTAATLYAAESMRLTTRLMQVASWLLLQRAANNGEMSLAQVAEEKSKVQLETPSASRGTQSWEELPVKFVSIVERSLALQTLVKRLDEEVYPKQKPVAELEMRRNPVVDQMDLLQAAFGGR